MKNKELTCRKARYLDILSKFNFQVIFQASKKKSKANTLTYMYTSGSTDKEVIEQSQTIFTLNQIDIWIAEIKPCLFDRITEANKSNNQYNELRQAIVDQVPTMYRVEIGRCQVSNGIFCVDDHVQVSVNLHTSFFRNFRSTIVYSSWYQSNRIVDLTSILLARLYCHYQAVHPELLSLLT